MATKLDAVTFEILRHRLWQISDEMAVIMKRVSGSPVTTEAGDFSVALYCANGDVMVVGSGVTLHVSTTSMVCKRVLERFGQSIGIAEGDVDILVGTASTALMTDAFLLATGTVTDDATPVTALGAPW